MKIGILTFQNTRNYGAMFQAYALQEKICSLGYDCDIIDYRAKFIDKNYKIIKLSEARTFKKIIKYIITNNNLIEKKEKFDGFVEKYLKLSKKTYTKENIDEMENDYDKIIVGSDQVWNLKLTGNETVYFLDLINNSNKKYSYAASFGSSNILDEHKYFLKQALNDFNKISVREETGKEIVKTVSNNTAKVVLDPTLLLSKKQWLNFASCQGDKLKLKKDYIFLYRIAMTPTIVQFTKKLAKKHNCEVVYVNDYKFSIFGFKNVFDFSPNEFLYYLSNARYVVTSSFHGVVLSINLNKNFFFELSNEKKNGNARIENIVSKLDLYNREIKNGENIDIQNNIDYKIVNDKLELLKKDSVNFLESILKD